MRLGVDHSTLTHSELDRTKPALWFLPAIVRFLGYAPWDTGGSPGERRLAFRREPGLSQAALAKRLGVDPRTLRNEDNVFQPADVHARSGAS